MSANDGSIEYLLIDGKKYKVESKFVEENESVIVGKKIGSYPDSYIFYTINGVPLGWIINNAEDPNLSRPMFSGDFYYALELSKSDLICAIHGWR